VLILLNVFSVLLLEIIEEDLIIFSLSVSLLHKDLYIILKKYKIIKTYCIIFGKNNIKNNMIYKKSLLPNFKIKYSYKAIIDAFIIIITKLYFRHENKKLKDLSFERVVSESLLPHDRSCILENAKAGTNDT
jgi:hypothetical protein